MVFYSLCFISEHAFFNSSVLWNVFQNISSFQNNFYSSFWLNHMRFTIVFLCFLPFLPLIGCSRHVCQLFIWKGNSWIPTKGKYGVKENRNISLDVFYRKFMFGFKKNWFFNLCSHVDKMWSKSFFYFLKSILIWRGFKKYIKF